ncbi:MAG: DUF2461 domain-containing protein [Acidimicrobiia bacterium]
MAFRGWPVEAVEFYEGLLADNSKAYWQEHKDVYEHCVLAPMEALLADLEGEFGPGRVFRPYRDVRFSKDKSPYKTAIAATLAEGGYLQMSADGLAAGCGLYRPASDQLERYRAAVADDTSGAALVKLVAAARAAKIDITAHETLKTAPRGYPKDHPRIDLLRQKGLIVWREWPVGAWLGTKKAKDRVVELLHTAAPINAWLEEHVGASELPDSFR